MGILHCSICFIIMGLGNWFFDELKVASSCYMAAAIEFSTFPIDQTTQCSTSSRGRSSAISKATPFWIC